jgi:segregation and condensation protein B
MSNNYRNIILTIIFTSPDPITFSDLSEKLNIPVSDIYTSIQMLKETLKETSLDIATTDNSVKLITKPEYGRYIKQFYSQKPQKLSDAAIETLTIIAYKQPITRQEIEEIREADCEKTLNTLVNARLIKQIGNLQQQGAPILYSITEECLYRFGVKNYQELNNIIKEAIESIQINFS